MSRGVWKTRGNGDGIKFLRALVGHTSDECIIWPFSRHPTGYAGFGYLGKSYYVHRFMCELAHGPSEFPKTQAAHSCHNQSCVNPRHLSWKTPSQNMLDKRANGTAHLNGGQGWKGKLTPEQVAEIRAMKGVKTLAVLSSQFGVTIKTIRSAQNGETYTGKAMDWKEINQRGAKTRRQNAARAT